MAVVETRKLTKVFKRGNVGAVNNVDLESREGEFLVLLGPSGSGKTTLLRMIAGLEEPTSGEILIGGRRRERPDATRARHRHGVPELRALSPSHGLQQHRLPAESAGRPERAPPETGRLGRLPAGHSAPFQPEAARALRGRAPARGSGPRHRPRAVALSARRAALQSRRQAARLGARRARTVPEAHRNYRHLRHARSGRSHGHGRSRGRHVPGRGAADRHAGGRLRRARRHLRGHVPRLAADEHPPDRERSRRIPAGAFPSCGNRRPGR